MDERLLPKGQYPHAENIRVSNSDASDVGAIENVKGNEKLTNLALTKGKTIGTFVDNSNQKIYWFVTSEFKDLVIEYDVVNSITSVLLESSKLNNVLNFSVDNLITGVSKIINGDYKKDLLVWTDDRNPIRKINIERAKTYGAEGFTSDEISLIKKPPRFAPSTTLTYTSIQTENAIEDSFFSFCYRYKYLDGEYSALSSFSNYKFSPNEFRLDYQTMENLGMVNSFNAISIKFNTGDKTVTDIQLVVKESNSNALAIIETFNKSEEGWANNTLQSFVFANSKKYTFLPEKELFRPYDNVPRVAKAMEVINNRLVFGNYVEQYDLVNAFGEEVIIDYELSLLSKSLAGATLPVTFSMGSVANDIVVIDLTGKALKPNTKLSINVNLGEVTYNNGSYSNLFGFILNGTFTNATGLAADADFISFVGSIMTNHFLSNYTAVPPANSTVLSTTGFSIVSSTATSISIKAPTITYRIDNTPLDTMDANFTDTISRWAYTTATSAAYREVAVNTSLKTNRSYEVGIIYMDGYGRSTTVITDKDNTIKIPQKFSTNQNVIVVNLNNPPPVFADRYKLVVKQNKAEFQTIYTNIFYEDGLFRWVKLEGANKDKVKEGDTLIVKSDLGGMLEDVIKVRVLEVTTKTKDFIEGNKNADGALIVEEAGLYMKIKPTGFDMNFTSATARTFEGSSHLRYPVNTYTNPFFGEGSVATANFVPYKLSAGSSVRIFIEFQARGSIEYKATYDKTFRVNGDFNSIQAWFNAEVVTLGSFGTDFTRGYGFSTGGQQFFARAHRDGTATRNITTTVRFEVLFSEGIVIFETEPVDTDNNIFYETEQTFEILNGYHQGNIQNQSSTQGTAIIELDFFNCYAQGNGAESYRYKDAFNKKFLNIDLRPSSTSIEKFKEIRRYADLTYSSGTYNENTNLNGLNEFNLSTANYKEDIDKKYGFIQKLYSKDTDLVVFQEDKVSRVLYGKDLLMNADGTSNVTSIESILGQQVPYVGEYGISRNAESFAFDANSVYFTDSKRGCVCRLGLNGITEISMAGMTNFFKETYRGAIDTRKFGAYDPYYDQYVLHNSLDSFTQVINLTCSQNLIRKDFFGKVVINMDYGLITGNAGISFTSNGVPVKYTVEYNGSTYSTGYRGDTSYNAELVSLGLPVVGGSGNSSLLFLKDLSIPRTAKITIEAPICGADFQVFGTCIASTSINVISIVLNDQADNGLRIKNRYRWSNPTYTSPFKDYNSVFEAGAVDIYDLVVGGEGTPQIPLTGSTVEIQSYKGFSDTATFTGGNKLGYLISNISYSEANFATVVSGATFLTPVQTIGGGGSITNSIKFNFARTVGQNYLYLIWDYRGI